MSSKEAKHEACEQVLIGEGLIANAEGLEQLDEEGNSCLHRAGGTSDRPCHSMSSAAAFLCIHSPGDSCLIYPQAYHQLPDLHLSP